MLNGYKVPGRSIDKIRQLAFCTRLIFGYDSNPKLDINSFIEHDLYENYKVALDVVEDLMLPNDYAMTDPNAKTIRVRNSVWIGAENGNGRDRYTLSHEVGHLFMHKNCVFARGKSGGSHKVYEDSEWQANVFAAEFLMPVDFVREAANQPMSYPVEAVQKTFGVSRMAAQKRLDSLEREGLL